MTSNKNFLFSMLFLRLTVFLVIFMWTIDKFINPEHAAKIFEHFYNIQGLGNVIIYAIGAVELIILLMFVVGFKKKFTYGAVLVFHAASTFSALGKYLSPFEGSNLLFFAAWPMLAACVMLYLMRDEDTLFQIS